jgi:RimJ/RimL family protein N-acetyltransferase
MDMASYNCLHKQEITMGEYTIVPIRYEDRLTIMKWRNEQMYHLRQEKILTENDQEAYFQNIIHPSFKEKAPAQILFSFLKNEKCIGYGGLVHINWQSNQAEVSFIMETELEADNFETNWLTFLHLLEKVAFTDLYLNSLFTYAYDLRPHLYKTIENAGFQQTKRLEKEQLIEGKLVDVVIHTKKNHLKLREATKNDVDLTFQWASDKNIRKYSFQQEAITQEMHHAWFNSKINDPDCLYLLLEKDKEVIGSIRYDINKENEALISYLIDNNYHGHGYGNAILSLSWRVVKEKHPALKQLVGFVVPENIASRKIFERQGYLLDSSDQKKLKYIKQL